MHTITKYIAVATICVCYENKMQFVYVRLMLGNNTSILHCDPLRLSRFQCLYCSITSTAIQFLVRVRRECQSLQIQLILFNNDHVLLINKLFFMIQMFMSLSLLNVPAMQLPRQISAYYSYSTKMRISYASSARSRREN